MIQTVPNDQLPIGLPNNIALLEEMIAFERGFGDRADMIKPMKRKLKKLKNLNTEAQRTRSKNE